MDLYVTRAMNKQKLLAQKLLELVVLNFLLSAALHTIDVHAINCLLINFLVNEEYDAGYEENVKRKGILTLILLNLSYLKHTYASIELRLSLFFVRYATKLKIKYLLN